MISIAGIISTEHWTESPLAVAETVQFPLLLPFIMQLWPSEAGTSEATSVSVLFHCTCAVYGAIFDNERVCSIPSYIVTLFEEKDKTGLETVTEQFLEMPLQVALMVVSPAFIPEIIPLFTDAMELSVLSHEGVPDGWAE